MLLLVAPPTTAPVARGSAGRGRTRVARGVPRRRRQEPGLHRRGLVGRPRRRPPYQEQAEETHAGEDEVRNGVGRGAGERAAARRAERLAGGPGEVDQRETVR